MDVEYYANHRLGGIRDIGHQVVVVEAVAGEGRDTCLPAKNDGVVVAVHDICLLARESDRVADCVRGSVGVPSVDEVGNLWDCAEHHVDRRGTGVDD